MTWMVVRLVLTLAFVGGVLWFAARLAKKKGLGGGNGLIEVVARQRMGRSSTVSVLRVADRVLVLDHGRIVEDGTPAELISRGDGRYAALHRAWVESLA